MIWNLCKERGVGAEGGTLRWFSCTCTPVHTHSHPLSFSHFNTISARRGEASVSLAALHTWVSFAFSGQGHGAKAFSPTLWSPLTAQLRWEHWQPSSPSAQCAPLPWPTSLHEVLRPLPKAPAAARVWCVQEEGQEIRRAPDPDVAMTHMSSGAVVETQERQVLCWVPSLITAKFS